MSGPDANAPLLKVENLSVAFRGRVVAENINFVIERGETQALVGESGSGKSVTALSILKLLPYPAASHPSGRILFRGEDLMTAPPERLREVRGGKISMIFQEPMTSLNPLHRIERQLVETLTLHRDLSREAARKEAIELLKLVQIRDAAKRMSAFPHELSGGQRQRVMIAMALANKPDLLIADEPTTAVDVTIQAQILKLLRELQARARHGDPADQPRPRHGAQDGARGGGDAERQDRRADDDRGAVQGTAASLHQAAAGGAAAPQGWTAPPSATS